MNFGPLTFRWTRARPAFARAVDIVLRAWTSERLSYTGQYYSFDQGGGAAQAAPATTSSGVDCRVLSSRNQMVRSNGLLDSDGPPFDAC